MLRPGESDFELWVPQDTYTIRVLDLDGPVEVNVDLKSLPIHVELR